MNNNGKGSHRKRPHTGSINGRLVSDKYKTQKIDFNP